MKQFYLLMVVGLLLSGFVLLGSELRDRDNLLDQLIGLTEKPAALILLGLFDFGVALANLVWVGKNGIVVLDNLLPSVILLIASMIFFYKFFLRELPDRKPKTSQWMSKTLSFIYDKSMWMGFLCLVMAFVHFFAEGIVLL